jgi:ketosteroid isomerase-like protein
VSEEPVEIVRRMNAAFNAGDYDALTTFFAPDAEFVDRMPLPDVAHAAHGPMEMRAVLDAWTEGFTAFEGHVEEYVDLDDFVVCATRWRFVSRDEDIELEWKGAEAWQLRRGKVVWGQAGFRDKQAAIEAVEQRLHRAP